MASSATGSSSKPQRPLKDLIEKGYGNLIAKIIQLKNEIEAGRDTQIKEKLDKSLKKLQSHVHEPSSNSSLGNMSSEAPRLGVECALCVLDGFPPGSTDKDTVDIHEAIFSRSTQLPEVQRIPPYTTWIFLDRNQRMAEDQSVVGRRRIYYDESGTEALVCSDSEEDITGLEEEKREFSEGEDRILWMAFEEYGLDEDVVDVVRHFIGGASSEILERYNELKLKGETSHTESSSERNVLLEKSLSAALDSFDNLFCRRCLVFDCRLHGCSQHLVYPSDRQSSVFESEAKKLCSDQCYLLLGKNTDISKGTSNMSSLHHLGGTNLEGKGSGYRVHSFSDYVGSENTGNVCILGSNTGEGPTAGALSAATVLPTAGHTIVGKRKSVDGINEGLEGIDSFNDSFGKEQKRILAAEAETGAKETVSAKAISSAETMILDSLTHEEINSELVDNNFLKGLSARSEHNVSLPETSPTGDILRGEACDVNKRKESKQSTYLKERKGLASSSGWKPIEKDLYAKGLEIFGRNSCLIARNLLSGLKTCAEVFNYMHKNGSLMAMKKDVVHGSEDHSRADTDFKEQEIALRSRSRIFRRRGRTRRLKYSSKSNGHPSSWKRVSDGDQSCKQYSPCTCQFMCGKDCFCLKNGTCCDKYCGCSKSCKNRFRGCHCAKSQCRSRQCPCFAANRECDPDVCRNCWVSCGGGSLGEPVKKGDGQCGNMRLLLKQRQRILLGRSDVAGWGAFIKNTVNKHDYLGEYTGELISHREADKRGKIYDRANSSFLFDLNDQYVLDACRQGDKLKFANHSSKPNCYCKVMLVAGDHRVGIFAKERIEAKEELFYDYRYGPDQAPVWAQKPESSNPLASQGRARKHQSR